MATKTYKYNVIIGVNVSTGGLTKGSKDVEDQLSRWERRALKAVKSIEKAMDALAKVENQIFTDNSRRGGGTGGKWGEEHKAILRTTQTLNRYELAIDKLSGKQTELKKLNQQLAQPGVSDKIDNTTKALLRQRAAVLDNMRAEQLATRAESRTKRNQFDFGLGSTAVIAAPVVAGAALLTRDGMEYEKSMNLFQATTRATAGEMERAGRTAVALGNDMTLTSVSAKGAGEAMTELGKGGFNAKQAMEAARGTLTLSIAANLSAAEAAEIQANALNMFSLQATEAGRVADLLAATANAASGEITDHTKALQQAGAVYAAAKVPIQDVVTLIAEMAKNGIKGSDAGTSLKTMMQRLQSPTDQAAAAMDKLNVKIYDQSGAMRPMRDIISQFENSLKGLSQEQRDQALNTIFGADAVRAATIIFKEGATGFDTMSAAVNRSNTATELAVARTKGLGGAWEALKSQAETLGLVIYGGIKDPLTAVITVAAKFIGLIGEYPNIFAAALVAVIGLTLAYTALNFQIGVSVLKQIPAFIAGIKTVIGLMLNVQTVMTMTAAQIAAVSIGFGALLVVIGLIAYAYANQETAIDRANKLTLDSVNANTQALQTYKQLAIEAQGVADAQEGSTDRHEKLNAVLGKLDPATKAYIQNLIDEKTQVKILTDTITKNIEVQKALLEAKLRTAAEGYLEATRKIEAENKSITENQKRITDLTTANLQLKEQMSQLPLGTQAWNALSLQITNNESQIKGLTNSNIQAGDSLKELNATQIQSAVNFAQSAKGLGWNNQMLSEYFTRLGYTKSQLDLIIGLTNENTNAQATMGNQIATTTDAVKDQTDAVFNLRQELNKLSGASQERVDRKTLEIIQNAKNKTDAAKMAREALKSDSDLKQSVEELKRIRESQKAVEDVFSPSERSGGGTRRTRSSRTPNPQADFRRENRVISGNAQWDKWVYEFASKYNIDPMLIFAQMSQESSFKLRAKSNKGASGLMQLMPGTAKDLGVTNIFDPKQNIEAGVKYLRQQLDKFGGNTALALAAYNAGPGAVQKFGGIPPYKETQGYVKRISERYQKLKGGKFELGANFDAERSLAEYSDKITKEARDADVMRAIEGARISGMRPDDDILRDYNRLQIEAARKEGRLQPTIDETQAEFKGFREIDFENGRKAFEVEKSINEVIRERFNLDEREEEYITRKVNFTAEVAARQEDYNLSLRESQQEIEIEAALLAQRNLDLEASVEFGRQQNTQYRELMDTEIALDVLRRQNADATFVTERRRLDAKREMLDLEKEQVSISDRIANFSVNQNQRITNALLRDKLNLLQQEEEAVISLNRNYLELSQKGNFSAVQANAQLIEFLNRNTKSLSEIYSSAEIGAVSAFWDALDASISKVTDKMGFFGDILKQVLMDLVKLATSKIFTGGFGGGGQQTGGGNWLQSIFSGIFNRGGGNRSATNGTQNTGTPGGGSNLLESVVDLTKFQNQTGMGNRVASLGGNIPALTTNTEATPLGGAMRQIVSGLPASIARTGLGAGATAAHEAVHAGVGTAGKFSLGNLGKSLGALAPMLGLSLGGTLGGGSMGGQILGMGGGLIAGTLLQTLIAGGFTGATATGGAFGSIGGLLGISGAATAGIALAVLPLILAGSYLLGRNKQRRADEKTRNQAMLDSFSALDKLISDVNSNKIDGAQALSQADEIRKNYLEQMRGLKSDKTRRIAMADVSRIDAKITVLKSAVKSQEQRKEKLMMMSPTFADGGSLSNFARNNFKNNPLGYISGPGSPRSDSIGAFFPMANEFAKISNSEYVLDAETTRNVGVWNLDRLRAGKGKNFGEVARMMKHIHEPRIQLADGGLVSAATTNGAGGSNNGSGTVLKAETNVYITQDGNGNITGVRTETFLDTPEGKQKVENIVEEKIYQNRGSGKIPVALNRVNRGQG